jgi:hypothetical protein
MNCDKTLELLPLFLYGELTFDEEEALEQHLVECAACRRAREHEETLHAALVAGEADVPAGLLARCRRDLGASIQLEQASRAKPAWYQRAADFLVNPPLWLRPIGALAMLAIGFGIARYQSGGEPIAFTSAPAPEPGQIARVRLVNHEPDGDVRVVYDEMNRREISGRLNDAPIRRALLAATSDSTDPGLQVDSMEALRGHASDETVREAFIAALRTDLNAGVRLKALESLKPFAHDPETRQALCDVVLTDKNATLRIAAIDLLVQNHEPEVAGVLQQVLRHESDSYVRSRSQKALSDMKASVGTF